MCLGELKNVSTGAKNSNSHRGLINLPHRKTEAKMLVRELCGKVPDRWEQFVRLVELDRQEWQLDSEAFRWICQTKQDSVAKADTRLNQKVNLPVAQTQTTAVLRACNRSRQSITMELKLEQRANITLCVRQSSCWGSSMMTRGASAATSKRPNNNLQRRGQQSPRPEKVHLGRSTQEHACFVQNSQGCSVWLCTARPDYQRLVLI